MQWSAVEGGGRPPGINKREAPLVEENFDFAEQNMHYFTSDSSFTYHDYTLKSNQEKNDFIVLPP